MRIVRTKEASILTEIGSHSVDYEIRKHGLALYIDGETITDIDFNLKSKGKFYKKVRRNKK